MKFFRRFLLIAVLLIIAGTIAIIFILPGIVKQKLVRFTEQHSDYYLEIGSIHLGMNELEVYEIRFKPKLDKHAYFKQKGFETDWIKGEIRALKIKGISWVDVIKGDYYEVTRVDIEQANVYVCRDKRFPNRFKYKPLPSSIFRNAGARFTIPEMNLNGLDVVYEQIQKKDGEVIRVSFSKLNAVTRHISSDSAYLSANPVMTIDAHGLILDSIKTKVRYTNMIKNKNDVFTLKGSISSFSATHLNHCIEPATKTRITDGFIKGIDFSFTADDNSSSGVLNMDYRDLKVEVDEEVKQNKIKTFLANVFIKNKDKKQEDERYTGEIDFKRRKDRFMFNYWWNSFKSGVVSSVLKKPAQEQLKNRSEKETKPDEHKKRKKDRKRIF